MLRHRLSLLRIPFIPLDEENRKRILDSRLLWGEKACPHLHQVISICLMEPAEAHTQHQNLGEFILTFWSW